MWCVVFCTVLDDRSKINVGQKWNKIGNFRKRRPEELFLSILFIVLICFDLIWLGLQTLTFVPYTFQQLQTIIKSRFAKLPSVSDWIVSSFILLNFYHNYYLLTYSSYLIRSLQGIDGIFSDEAIEYCARKVISFFEHTEIFC